MKKLFALFLICFIVAVPLFFITGEAEDKYIIKFATLAPKGSTWMNVIEEFDKSIREESKGRLELKIYPGGVSGDEMDMIRKIRIGQLHGGGFTGSGMGKIASEIRVLETPFLFKNYGEIDYTTNKLNSKFAKSFEDKGFVLLGWSEVGFVYILTNKPVKSVADMKDVKMWMWEGDPIAEATFNGFKLTAVPLSVTEVLTSLQTKLIDGVYASPLAAISMQWFTKVKYILDLPLAYGAGAMLISKKMYDSMPPDLQTILMKNGSKYSAKLSDLTRKDNESSISVMKEQGIEIIKIDDPKTIEGFYNVGKDIRNSLVGKLYSQELLSEVENTIMEYRKTK